jgi:cytochrome c556
MGSLNIVFCQMYFGLIFRSACSVAAIAVALCALGGAASSDDAALSALKDEIFARKILMDSIDSHMDAIDWMVSSGKAIDMPKAVEHAETISIMLMAFPHLFPASSNQWRPNAKRNPGRDTFAAPELWANYADFYRRAAEASRIAFDASRTKREADFRMQFATLRNTCDSCHATYLKTGE